jgi:biotin carboxyl carrier protein
VRWWSALWCLAPKPNIASITLNPRSITRNGDCPRRVTPGLGSILPAAATQAHECRHSKVIKAKHEDLSRELVLTAEFRPFQEIDVHAKVAGFVKKIYVDVGDRVKEGQLLTVL